MMTLIQICPARVMSSLQSLRWESSKLAYEVDLPQGLEAKGAILCDQIKSLDWRAQHARRLGSVPEAVMPEVTARNHHSDRERWTVGRSDRVKPQSSPE
jgi:mRNA-degrading endonuclease toxin of MazEF toxin-antitoxin module